MPTIYARVTASADDAREASTGATSITDTTAESDALAEWLAWRFDGIAIPQGATINTAILRLVPTSGGVDEPDHTFFGEDADDAAAFAATANNISGRARTTASVVWSSADLGAGGTTYFSPPDMAAIIQEIVDRVGWASGNAIALMCQGSASGARDLGVLMFDGFPDSCALLEINFDWPTGTEFTGQVAASADDAREETVGAVAINGVSLESDAATEWIGIRINNVTIPQGANILYAALAVMPIDASSDEPDHVIFGEDVDDAAQFTTTVNSISSRARTTASVAWNEANLQALGSSPTFRATPDLKTILQEIVDRPGWASGNAVVFLIQGSADANRDLNIYAFDNATDPARAAKLEAVYEAGSIDIDLTTVEVEVELPAWDVDVAAGPIDIALASVEVEVELPAWTVTGTGIEITLDPVEIEVELPDWTVGTPIEIDLFPVLVDVELPDWEVRAVPVAPGDRRSAIEVYNVGGTKIAGPVPVLDYKTDRYLNRVGAWAVSLPANGPLVDGVPLARQMKRGWRVNIIHEGTHPLNDPSLDYLLFQGVVEDKTYQIDRTGKAVSVVSGSFRGIDLAARITPTSAAYELATMQAVAEDIVGDLAGGVTVPVNGTRQISIAFNNEEGDGVIGRYLRLIKLCEMARWVIRESWYGDALELIPIEAPPSSRYTMLNQDHAGFGYSPGIALIGGTPELRREGRGIVNRIIPFGSDTITELDEQSETTLLLGEHRYGIDPIAAPILTLDAQPTAGQTIVVQGVQYTWIDASLSGPPDSTEIDIGLNVAVALGNLRAAINGTDAAHPTPNIFARAEFAGGNTLRIFPQYQETGSNDVSITGSALSLPGNDFEEGDLGEARATRQVPLTLEHATRTFPYEVQAGVNDDGSLYYFLEDTPSIETYGLTEMQMHRADIKNPTDSVATREAAANVLYQIAWGELLKNRSPKVFLTVPLANGDQVWAIPGDRIRVEYSGYVLVDGEVEVWEEFSGYFLVIERHEQIGEKGVRLVSLVIATPEVEIAIDGLPESLGLDGGETVTDPGGDTGGEPGEGGETTTTIPNSSLPVTTINPWDTLGPSVGLPAGPGQSGGFGGNGGGGLFPSCCEDRTTTVTDIPDPNPDEDEHEECVQGWASAFGGGTVSNGMKNMSENTIHILAFQWLEGAAEADITYSPDVEVIELETGSAVDLECSQDNNWRFIALVPTGPNPYWVKNSGSVWRAIFLTNCSIVEKGTTFEFTSQIEIDTSMHTLIQGEGLTIWDDEAIAETVLGTDEFDACAAWPAFSSTALEGDHGASNRTLLFGGETRTGMSSQLFLAHIGVTDTPATVSMHHEDAAGNNSVQTVCSFVVAFAVKVRINT